jgi:sirohydrochlorin ferrochelatase
MVDVDGGDLADLARVAHLDEGREEGRGIGSARESHQDGIATPKKVSSTASVRDHVGKRRHAAVP